MPQSTWQVRVSRTLLLKQTSARLWTHQHYFQNRGKWVILEGVFIHSESWAVIGIQALILAWWGVGLYSWLAARKLFIEYEFSVSSRFWDAQETTLNEWSVKRVFVFVSEPPWRRWEKSALPKAWCIIIINLFIPQLVTHELLYECLNRDSLKFYRKLPTNMLIWKCCKTLQRI